MPSTKTPAARLAEPLTFPVSGRTAPNRLLSAAMSESLATWDDVDFSKRGIPTEEYINLYKVWGEGGWGQVLTGNIQIEPDHLEAEKNAIIPLDAPFSGPRFEGFKATAAAAKAHGGLIVAQVSHPGRQVHTHIQEHPISASDVQLFSPIGKFSKPRPATQEDINRVIEEFAHAAEYLEKTGFDGIQIHGAHGYLIAQFLSPTTNKRTDKYGGNVTNRARLALEIAEAVRRRVSPNFIVGIKINSVEFHDGGITGDDAAQLCAALEEAGFDYFELSGGTYEKLAFTHMKESTRKREAFFMEFAETIMRARRGGTGREPKVYITGGFQTAEGMAGALDVVDGVGLGKAAAADPAIAGKLAQGESDKVPPTSIPDDNFFAGLVCAKAQLQQIGAGKPPMDLSVPEAWQPLVEAVMASQKPQEG